MGRTLKDARSSARSLKLGLVLASFLGGAAVFGQAQGLAMRPVPRPDLSLVSPTERVLLRDARVVLDRLASDPGRGRDQLAEAFGGMGQLYLAFDFDDAALGALFNASNLAPDNFDWAYYLGVAYQRRGDSESAEQMLRHARSVRPEDAPNLIRLGAVQLDLGYFHGARSSFVDALTLDPENAGVAARYGLGLVLSAQSAFAASIEHYEAVLEAQPEATSVHYPLSRAYLRIDNLDAARTHRTAGGAGPVVFADPLVEHLRSLAAGAAVHIMLGRDGVQRGRPDLAISAFRAALRADPTNIVARQELAAQLRATGDIEGAEAEYRTILDLQPKDALAHYNLATALAERGEADEAIAHYRSAIVSKPDFKEALFNLGNALLRERAFAEAATQFRRVLELEPTSIPARQQLADCLRAMGRSQQAILELRESVEQNPESGEAQLRLAAMLTQQRLLDDAEVALRTALSLGLPPQRQALAWATLGDVARRRGTMAAALTHYRQALQLAPDFLGARYRIAETLHLEKQYSKAADEYLAIIAVRPDQEPAHIGLVSALLRAKRYTSAAAAYEEALAALPLSVRIAHGFARFLATSPSARTRNGGRALEMALSLAGEHATREFIEVVAMAYAEVGQFADAVAWQERVVADVEAAGLEEQARTQRKRLEDYRRGKPCRAPWAAARPSRRR